MTALVFPEDDCMRFAGAVPKLVRPHCKYECSPLCPGGDGYLQVTHVADCSPGSFNTSWNPPEGLKHIWFSNLLLSCFHLGSTLQKCTKKPTLGLTSSVATRVAKELTAFWEEHLELKTPRIIAVPVQEGRYWPPRASYDFTIASTLKYYWFWIKMKGRASETLLVSSEERQPSLFVQPQGCDRYSG